MKLLNMQNATTLQELEPSDFKAVLRHKEKKKKLKNLCIFKITITLLFWKNRLPG